MFKMTDKPQKLNLVSPCKIAEDWDGSIFAELEVTFLKKLIYIYIYILTVLLRLHSATQVSDTMPLGSTCFIQSSAKRLRQQRSYQRIK